MSLSLRSFHARCAADLGEASTLKHFHRPLTPFPDNCHPLGLTLNYTVSLASPRHIDAHVLYDRAPHFFHQLSPEEEHDLFTKLANELAEPMHEGDCCAAGIDGAPQVSGGDNPYAMLHPTSLNRP